MSDWLYITLIVLSQLAILETIYIVFFMSRKKPETSKVDIRQAKEIFSKFVHNNERKHKTLKALHDIYEFEDALSESRLKELLQLENLLEKSIIEAIAKGELKYIDKIHTALDSLVSFHTRAAAIMKENQKEKYNSMRSEFCRLEADRDRLRDELATTLDTMSQTLDDYSKVYRISQQQQQKQNNATLQQTVKTDTRKLLDPIDSLSTVNSGRAQLDQDVTTAPTLDLSDYSDIDFDDIPELTDIVDEHPGNKRRK